MKTYLTLDVGGSAIKYALIQEDLTILEKSSVPTPMDALDHFIETIGQIYDQYQDQIAGMALSMPGIIDPERGYQYTGGALRYIDKLETVEVLKKDVQQILQLVMTLNVLPMQKLVLVVYKIFKMGLLLF